MHLRKRNYFLPLLIICALAAIILLVVINPFEKSSSFSSISDINKNSIDKIEVQAGWGDKKEITSTDNIQSIIEYLDQYQYKRDSLQPNFTGYVYVLKFYSKDINKGSFEIGGTYPIINNNKYKVMGEMDLDKIKRIIGLYPPGSN